MASWNQNIGITNWQNNTNTKQRNNLYTNLIDSNWYIGITNGNKIPLPTHYPYLTIDDLSATKIHVIDISASDISANKIQTIDLSANYIATVDLSCNTFYANNGTVYNYLNTNHIITTDISANNILTTDLYFRDKANPSIDVLNVVNGQLYLNGSNILISTVSTSVLQWSQYPAIHNVDMNNYNLLNVNGISTTYLQSQQAQISSLKTNSILTSSLTAYTISSINASFSNLSSLKGNISSLSVSSISGSFANKLSTSLGVLSNFSTIYNPSSFSNWSYFPAQTDINANSHNINNINTLNVYGGGAFSGITNNLYLNNNLITGDANTYNVPNMNQYFSNVNLATNCFDIESITTDFTFTTNEFKLATDGYIVPTGAIQGFSHNYRLVVPSDEFPFFTNYDYRGRAYLGTAGYGAGSYIRMNYDYITEKLPNTSALIEINADSALNTIGELIGGPSRISITGGVNQNLGTFSNQLYAGYASILAPFDFAKVCAIDQWAPAGFVGGGIQTSIVNGGGLGSRNDMASIGIKGSAIGTEMNIYSTDVNYIYTEGDLYLGYGGEIPRYGSNTSQRSHLYNCEDIVGYTDNGIGLDVLNVNSIQGYTSNSFIKNISYLVGYNQDFSYPNAFRNIQVSTYSTIKYYDSTLSYYSTISSITSTFYVSTMLFSTVTLRSTVLENLRNVSSFNSTLTNYGLITSNVIQGISTTLSSFIFEGKANFSNLNLKNTINNNFSTIFYARSSIKDYVPSSTNTSFTINYIDSNYLGILSTNVLGSGSSIKLSTLYQNNTSIAQNISTTFLSVNFNGYDYNNSTISTLGNFVINGNLLVSNANISSLTGSYANSISTNLGILNNLSTNQTSSITSNVSQWSLYKAISDVDLDYIHSLCNVNYLNLVNHADNSYLNTADDGYLHLSNTNDTIVFDSHPYTGTLNVDYISPYNNSIVSFTSDIDMGSNNICNINQFYLSNGNYNDFTAFFIGVGVGGGNCLSYFDSNSLVYQAVAGDWSYFQAQNNVDLNLNRIVNIGQAIFYDPLSATHGYISEQDDRFLHLSNDGSGIIFDSKSFIQNLNVDYINSYLNSTINFSTSINLNQYDISGVNNLTLNQSYYSISDSSNSILFRYYNNYFSYQNPITSNYISIASEWSAFSANNNVEINYYNLNDVNSLNIYQPYGLGLWDFSFTGPKILHINGSPIPQLSYYPDGGGLLRYVAQDWSYYESEMDLSMNNFNINNVSTIQTFNIQFTDIPIIDISSNIVPQIYNTALLQSKILYDISGTYNLSGDLSGVLLPLSTFTLSVNDNPFLYADISNNINTFVGNISSLTADLSGVYTNNLYVDTINAYHNSGISFNNGINMNLNSITDVVQIVSENYTLYDAGTGNYANLTYGNNDLYFNNDGSNVPLVSKWANYPASNSLNMCNYNISNVSNIYVSTISSSNISTINIFSRSISTINISTQSITSATALISSLNTNLLSAPKAYLSSINNKPLNFNSTLQNVPISTFTINGSNAGGKGILLYSNVYFPRTGNFGIQQKAILSLQSASGSATINGSILYTPGIYISSFDQKDAYITVPMPDVGYSTFTTLQSGCYVSTNFTTYNIIYSDPSAAKYTMTLQMGLANARYFPSGGNSYDT